ncbi:MAG: MotA/TolQ/ExbB proton channel family protein [Alphaproteobacteria bacterium]|nr:MotA/TolQ/ExbB proton channel family protein [Alphaproteobacteria bacterium]
MQDVAMIEFLLKMGPLGGPLMLCSVVSLAVILDRGAALLRARPPRRRDVEQLLALADKGARDELIQAVERIPPPFGNGAGILARNAGEALSIREDLAALWLVDLHRALTRNLRLLNLIAVISPLLGLLGTVVGMIMAFQHIAAIDRPVNPAVVADGLWQAMLTTAFGLIIAVPALLCVHLYRMRIERLTGGLESDLNRLNLTLEIARRKPEREARDEP